MLTIPIDRITVLLAHASDVEIIGEDDLPEGEGEGEDTEFTIADTPAFRALTAALGELTPEEIYELLAVAEMGDSDDAEDLWDPAVERAKSVAEDEAFSELLRMLVLTDALENGLERLGYELDDDENGEAEEEQEDDETAVE